MARARWRDETLTCARCGITFLWPVEEQKRAFETVQEADVGGPLKAGMPTLCPACRYLSPAPGRERGVVKWFSARRQYGFITCQDGPDVFVHRSRLQDSGRLYTGDLVEFTVAKEEQGPMASEVRLLQRTPPPTASRET